MARCISMQKSNLSVCVAEVSGCSRVSGLQRRLVKVPPSDGHRFKETRRWATFQRVAGQPRPPPRPPPPTPPPVTQPLPQHLSGRLSLRHTCRVPLPDTLNTAPLFFDSLLDAESVTCKLMSLRSVDGPDSCGGNVGSESRPGLGTAHCQLCRISLKVAEKNGPCTNKCTGTRLFGSMSNASVHYLSGPKVLKKSEIWFFNCSLRQRISWNPTFYSITASCTYVCRNFVVSLRNSFERHTWKKNQQISHLKL